MVSNKNENMSTPKYILHELDNLKTDLHDLKRCQLHYFTMAITGTGGIIGLADALSNSAEGLAILIPLVIILPCWLIFFDKATTITRNTGYQRALEKLLTVEEKDFCGYEYKGYESALAIFREHEDSAWKKIKGKLPKYSLLAMLILRTRHRYWMINWYTFALLSTVCCVGSYATLSSDPSNTNFHFLDPFTSPKIICAHIAFLLVFITAITTFIILITLAKKRRSYPACTLIWKWVLSKDYRITNMTN